MPEVDSAKKAATQKLLDTSKMRFEMCQEAEKDFRELALDDLRFRAGEQWPENLKQQRAMEKRPCLTINVLPARERQILNNQRENRPAIKVSPVGEGADEGTADILQGMVRHIEYDSDADTAYDTASASQCRSGFGFIRLLTEYEDYDSDNQVIKIDRMPNPFQAYLDPSSLKADKSDAKFGFVFQRLTKEEYKEEYPGTELASLDDWDATGDKEPEWLSDEGVRIVEYFYIEYVDHPQGKKRGGKVIKKPVVKWCKHNKIEILEETEWPGRWIPLIPVLGDEVIVDGKVTYEGMVRWSKDPMRMKNVMASSSVESILLAPKAPWLAVVGTTEDFPEWKTANTQNHAVLRYKQVDVGGQPAPPPQRIIAEPAIQAITESGAYFDEALRDVQGIYQAQYGSRSNEVSGKAITAKKVQGELSNFHYSDNLTRSIKFLGRQIIDLIPKIYTREQVVRIIAEDGTQKLVTINGKPTGDPMQKIYDVTTGRYDVAVTVGPSYQTKRQEAVQSMIELTSVYPKLAEVAGDLLVSSMDWPNHEKVAERIKKTLPQGIADDDQSDPKVALQQAQAQMKQMGDQIGILSKVNEEQDKIIHEKQVEQNGKMQVEQLHAETQITVATIAAKSAEAKALIDIEFKKLGLEADLKMALHNSAHDAGMGAQKGADARQAQASDQQHESGMADKNAEIAAQQSDQGHAQTLEQQQQAAELQPEPAAQ